MEREGEVGEREMRKEGRGRRGGEKMRGLVIGGMVIGLLLGCNNGMAELEKKNSFYESVVKIGQGFQDIFGIFGKAMGDALGFDAVKSSDNKNKVGEHFEGIGKGLKSTKEKLDGLMKDITSAPNADTKGVEVVISSAIGVIENLIASVEKLAGVTKESVLLGDNHDNATAAAEKTGVEAMIEGIKAIIGESEKSGLKINTGNPGKQVTAGADTDAPAVLGGHSSKAGSGAGTKLADEVAKADPWAMIDKIKGAKAIDGAQLAVGSGGNNNHEVAALAASNNNASGANNGAKTNADLAAAVALKAMIKGGKFSANSADVEAVKGAAANAVNKVLGVLDEIIRRTVASELSKVGKAVNGMQYSENIAEKSEGATK